MSVDHLDILFGEMPSENFCPLLGKEEWVLSFLTDLYELLHIHIYLISRYIRYMYYKYPFLRLAFSLSSFLIKFLTLISPVYPFFSLYLMLLVSHERYLCTFQCYIPILSSHLSPQSTWNWCNEWCKVEINIYFFQLDIQLT